MRRTRRGRLIAHDFVPGLRKNALPLSKAAFRASSIGSREYPSSNPPTSVIANDDRTGKAFKVFMPIGHNPARRTARNIRRDYAVISCEAQSLSRFRFVVLAAENETSAPFPVIGTAVSPYLLSGYLQLRPTGRAALAIGIPETNRAPMAPCSFSNSSL